MSFPMRERTARRTDAIGLAHASAMLRKTARAQGEHCAPVPPDCARALRRPLSRGINWPMEGSHSAMLVGRYGCVPGQRGRWENEATPAAVGRISNFLARPARTLVPAGFGSFPITSTRITLPYILFIFHKYMYGSCATLS